MKYKFPTREAKKTKDVLNTYIEIKNPDAKNKKIHFFCIECADLNENSRRDKQKKLKHQCPVSGASGRPFGRLRGASGRPLGASGRPPGGVFGALGGILGTKAPKKPSRIPKDASQSPPRRPQEAPNGRQRPPKRGPRGPQEAPKGN